jgi:hypothetical protein
VGCAAGGGDGATCRRYGEAALPYRAPEPQLAGPPAPPAVEGGAAQGALPVSSYKLQLTDSELATLLRGRVPQRVADVVFPSTASSILRQRDLVMVWREVRVDASEELRAELGAMGLDPDEHLRRELEKEPAFAQLLSSYERTLWHSLELFNDAERAPPATELRIPEYVGPLAVSVSVDLFGKTWGFVVGDQAGMRVRVQFTAAPRFSSGEPLPLRLVGGALLPQPLLCPPGHVVEDAQGNLLHFSRAMERTGWWRRRPGASFWEPIEPAMYYFVVPFRHG